MQWTFKFSKLEAAGRNRIVGKFVLLEEFASKRELELQLD